MGIMADGASVLFIFEGSMDDLFLGDTIMAVVTELGPFGRIEENMVSCTGFMTKLTSIIAFA